VSQYIVNLKNEDTVSVEADDFMVDEGFYVFTKGDHVCLHIPAGNVHYVGKKDPEPAHTIQIVVELAGVDPATVSEEALKSIHYDLRRAGIRY
jgi:hypothetical protein